MKSPMTLVTDTTHTLLQRYPANPILESKDWPYPINSVFNAGATLLPDGTTLLLCRVEDRRGLSHLLLHDRRTVLTAGRSIQSQPSCRTRLNIRKSFGESKIRA